MTDTPRNDAPAASPGRGGTRWAAAALAGALATGCTALSPQLPPTDFSALERVVARSDRETAYAEKQIYAHHEPQGRRYTKGTDAGTQKRSWQSLDAVLRSDQYSAAALPFRQQRISRLFTALTVVASIVTVAGAAASAREGLNLGELNGTGAMLLGGGLATVGFGITAGIFYGKTRRGYQNAVDIYNDSLGMRLGILDGDGEFIPARGTILDKDGFVVLDPTVDDRPEDVAVPAEDVAATPTSAPAAPAEDVAEPASEPAADDAAAEPPSGEGSGEGPAEGVAEPPADPPAEPPAGDAVVDPAPDPPALKPASPRAVRLQLLR